MKHFQNAFTTPEQSKRLLELGIPADSADCYFYEEGCISNDAYPEVVPFGEKYEDASKEEMFTSYVSLPCWSLGRLIEIYATVDILVVIDDMVEYLINEIECSIKNKRFDFSKFEEQP
jgi:hypothetical protein